MSNRRAIGALATLLLAGVCGSASGADEPGRKPAIEAQAVLARHCSRCHGDGPKPRAGLNVLARDALVKRKVVQPGLPEASELIDLVAGGTMPPGTHPKLAEAEVAVLRAWVKSGAPAVSPGDYALHHLLADWKQLPAADRPHARYLSLAHLLDASRDRVLDVRHDLERLLTSLRRTDRTAPAILEPVDPREAVYRIDLAGLGWSRRPFKRKDGKVVLGDSKVNLHDLTLLEYPYAILPQGIGPDLAAFLKATEQVRPISYLRGDWLVALLGETDVFDDVARLVKPDGETKRPALRLRGFWNEAVAVEEVEADLGWKGDRAKLLQAVRQVGLPELTEGKKVSRRVWEARLARLVDHLNLGTAIAPIDGVTWPDYSGAELTLHVASKDFRTGAAQTRFRQGVEFAFQVRVNQPAEAELVLGYGSTLANAFARPQSLEGEQSLTRVPGRGWNLREKATVYATLYAVVKANLRANEVEYPMGVRLDTGAKKDRDRIVHPLYELTADGSGIKPVAKMTKATVKVEIE